MKNLTVYNVEENLLALLDTEEMVEKEVEYRWEDAGNGDFSLVLEESREIIGRVLSKDDGSVQVFVGTDYKMSTIGEGSTLEEAQKIVVEALVPKSEDRLAFLNDLAEASAQAVTKRDNCIKFLLHINSQIAAIKTETERLAALKATYVNGKARFSEYLVKIIEEFAPQPKRGNKKLEGSIGVLSIAKKPDTVDIEDPAKIPYSMMDVDVKLKGSTFNAIRQRLGEAGHDDLVGNITTAATYRPRRADVQKAILGGEMIDGADIKFGGNRLAVR